MKIIDIKQWQVENGIAKPVKHFHCTEKTFVACINLPDGITCDECCKQIEFNNWAKQNTIATNAPPGIHSSEMFGEIVWQFMNVKFVWIDCVGNDNSFSKAHGFSTRQFLPFNHPVEPNDKQPVKDSRDAGYFEILSNMPGKEQDGINRPILKLWGEVENFYGDPHKNETGRQLLLRIQDTYDISFKVQPPNPNANAIKIIQDRKIELKAEWLDKDNPFPPDYYNAIINELNHILKLLQS